MTRLPATRAALVLLALLGLLAACSLPQMADEDTVSDADAGAPAIDEVSEEAPAEPDVFDEREVAEADRDVAQGEPGEAAEPEVPSDDGDVPLPAQAGQAGRGGEHVIKEGTVTLEVDEGEFPPTYERVVEAARREGGSVAASHSATDGQGRTSGAVTVRVPVENYESLLVAIGRIADPVAQDIRSEDVTGQVVDLESRLRHLRAQEAFYLELLEEAADVQDAIRIQQQVDDIQQRIEQLQGRLDFLTDRADYSTLTVEIAEAGADTVLITARDEEPSLALYWDYARTGFVTLIGWMLVAAVTLAPLAVPVGLALLAWRLAVRRRPETPGTVAAETD